MCKLETVQCQSFLFPYACVWISSAPCTGAGMKLQLLVFKFCRSLLFQCCLRPSSEIRAGMTLSTNPAGLVINACYSFSPVTQRAPGSPVSSAALFCSVLNNFHNLRKTSSCLDLYVACRLCGNNLLSLNYSEKCWRAWTLLDVLFPSTECPLLVSLLLKNFSLSKVEIKRKCI